MTDDWDRRCIMTILADFYQPNVLEPGHKFSEAGVYHQLKGETPHEVMRQVYLITNYEIKPSLI